MLKKSLEAVGRTSKGADGEGRVLSLLCRIANVCRATYYRSLKATGSRLRRERAVELIRGIQERDGYVHGVLDMTACLRRLGVGISHNTVDKYMSENDLHARTRLRRFPDGYYRAVAETRRSLPANVLGRNFSIGVPRNIYATDITYVPVVGGWVYKCVVKDLFNNEVVAWGMSAHPDSELCIRCVDMLGAKRDLRGAVIHSDMGSTYTSKAYRARLAELGVVQSMSRRGQCWDNACAESYFAIYKTECFSGCRRDLLMHRIEREDVMLMTERWIDHYNKRRLQKRLGWLSPVMYGWFHPNGRLPALPAPDRKCYA